MSPWFDYPVQVYPHHTDYAGVVWHGAYVTWLEELRIAYLQHHNTSYAALVADGCELPVIAMALQYRKPLYHGQQAVLRGQMVRPQGLRLVWNYELRSTPPDAPNSLLYLTAQVTLAPISTTTRKPLRHLPPALLACFNRPPL